MNMLIDIHDLLLRWLLIKERARLEVGARGGARRLVLLPTDLAIDVEAAAVVQTPIGPALAVSLAEHAAGNTVAGGQIAICGAVFWVDGLE